MFLQETVLPDMKLIEAAPDGTLGSPCNLEHQTDPVFNPLVQKALSEMREACKGPGLAVGEVVSQARRQVGFGPVLAALLDHVQ
jgi:hypothetical protein